MQEPLQRREKWLIIGGLVVLTIVAWIFTLYQAGFHAGMQTPASKAVWESDSATRHLGQTHGGMSMEPTVVPRASVTMALEANLFLVMWVAMMVAMMFPSVYPMVLLFARVSKRQSGPTRVSTGTHLGVYGWLLAIWTVVGGIMYTLDLTLRWMGGHVAWFGDWATVGIAIILIGVGLYQLSAWKGIYLTHCRSPLSFVLHKWRQGKEMPQHQGHACVHTAISQSRPGAETVDGHHWGMLRGEWELKLTSPTPPIVRGLFRAR